MTLRFTSNNLAGTLRKLVAVGTVRLFSIFVAIAADTPRNGSGSPSGMISDMAIFGAGGSTPGEVTTGCGLATSSRSSGGSAGRMISAVLSAFGVPAGLKSLKNSFHVSPTEFGSSRKRSYISSTSHELAPKSSGFERSSIALIVLCVFRPRPSGLPKRLVT